MSFAYGMIFEILHETAWDNFIDKQGFYSQITNCLLYGGRISWKMETTKWLLRWQWLKMLKCAILLSNEFQVHLGKQPQLIRPLPTVLNVFGWMPFVWLAAHCCWFSFFVFYSWKLFQFQLCKILLLPVFSAYCESLQTESHTFNMCEFVHLILVSIFPIVNAQLLSVFTRPD